MYKGEIIDDSEFMEVYTKCSKFESFYVCTYILCIRGARY